MESQEKVLAICKSLHADAYINAAGGKTLYSRDAFQKEGIDLRFIESKWIEYNQFDHEFVPWLSIVDVLMFNPTDRIREFLELYTSE